MINPILASSARRRMRSLRTPIIVTLYGAALVAFALLYSFAPFSGSALTIGQMRQGVEGYTLLIGLQFALLVLVAPAMTAGSIAGERERQTLDLLRVTNTNSLSIALGKLLESFGFLCLLILSSMPVLSLVLFTGGVSLGQMVIATLFLLMTALAALSVGLFCSALFKRVAAATVVSYLSIFALGIVTLVPIFWDVDKLGEIYVASYSMGLNPDKISYVPLSFAMNPGLGLMCLFASQTQAQLVLSLFGRVSHTLSVSFVYMDFGRYLLYHMVFLGLFSIVLVGLSALLVRPRVRQKGQGKRRKA